MPNHDVMITGIGIVSSLGEGGDAHLAIFDGAKGHVDSETFQPYSVYAAPPLELDRHIPKKSDQRQMEPWQRMGTYAAGAALEDAGLKGDAEALQRMNLIVACGGGERDYAVDGSILTGMRDAADKGVYLNERLMSDIRPTLFLAQLSNLLAGNISIVHGVIGGSRTFMGEEQAGVDAIRIAEARIRSGQNDVFMVGGAVNAERADVILSYETGGAIWRKPDMAIKSRQGGGFVPGSAAAFLILESAERAKARGAKVYARLGAVQADRCRRQAGEVTAGLQKLIQATGTAPTVLSGNAGFGAASAEEATLLANHGARVIATGEHIGHSMEAQFPAGVAMAALGLKAGKLKEAALVISVGHHRGEGCVRVEALS